MISIVIPTYNEAENISRLVHYLKEQDKQKFLEIIVSDSGSADTTVESAIKAGARAVQSPQKGRAAQMNYGASFASGDTLYFIHADTLPPASFIIDIKKAIADGYGFGRYRTLFDSKKMSLKVNAFFTRFDLFICYGGDQTLFIKKELFNSIGGFTDSMLIMEDYEIIERAKRKAKYKIMQKDALVSARKYETNNWLTVQTANYRIIRMYKKGASQMDMIKKYKTLLKYR
jgi:rSAM/selenodomain-associated transferase 2